MTWIQAIITLQPPWNWSPRLRSLVLTLLPHYSQQHRSEPKITLQCSSNALVHVSFQNLQNQVSTTLPSLIFLTVFLGGSQSHPTAGKWYWQESPTPVGLLRDKYNDLTTDCKSVPQENRMQVKSVYNQDNQDYVYNLNVIIIQMSQSKLYVNFGTSYFISKRTTRFLSLIQSS